jgi:hypothetical protein
MALTVCCPCGNPLDCDHLELVVSLTCPRCNREIALEVQLGPARHAFAILTIMEGPCWVGEQFVMPVGQELLIGKAPGNWLSLESDALSDVHCRLRLSENGRVTLEDLESESGTWIGSQRIVRGRLGSLQSFSAGGFRFRLDMPSPNGTTVAMPSPAAGPAERQMLPTLTKLTHEGTLPDQLISSRFLWSRRAIITFGWMTGIYHTCSLLHRPGSFFQWPAAVLLGIVIGASLTAAARRVTIGRSYSKYAALTVLLLLIIVDMAWKLPGGAAAALGLGAAVAMLLAGMPSEPLAVTAGAIGFISLLLSAVVTMRSLIILVASWF